MGHHILEVVTSCSHQQFQRAAQAGRRAYLREKRRVLGLILDAVEARYIPDLRRHITMRVSGTPLTSEKYCGSPFGNAYGAELTPENVTLARKPFEMPVRNLWAVNATAGFPSIAGTVASGIRLFEQLEHENPARGR